MLQFQIMNGKNILKVSSCKFLLKKLNKTNSHFTHTHTEVANSNLFFMSEDSDALRCYYVTT